MTRHDLAQLLYYPVTSAFVAFEEGNAPAVEILRVGTFIDKNGREVEVTKDDLDAYIANFDAGAAGQDVPIDIDHQRAEAGGWVKRLQRQGDRLLAWIDWNDLGRQLVGDKVYRYMSATIDLVSKVIRSVSLVNFPAVKGLKPVELSEGAYSMQQAGFFETIQAMLADLISRGKTSNAPLELADGQPGTITISQYLTATLHKMFTHCADNLALTGYLSPDERMQMSGAIASGLEALTTGLGDAGGRLIPSPNYYPDTYFKAPVTTTAANTKTEVITMTTPQTIVPVALTEDQIRAEERQRIEVELAERNRIETELREAIRKEETALAEARFKERQGLAEFAAQVCNGPAALSCKPDDVVELLEALPADKRDQAKAILSAKIVAFSEKGSGGDGKPPLPKLPDYARKDVLAGVLTVAKLFKSKAVSGLPTEYDLSEFTAQQVGL